VRRPHRRPPAGGGRHAIDAHTARPLRHPATYRSPPGSFYGAWILALTAHSDVLATVDGGDGRVALHGVPVTVA
jgi:hypothetical protein